MSSRPKLTVFAEGEIVGTVYLAKNELEIYLGRMKAESGYEKICSLIRRFSVLTCDANVRRRDPQQVLEIEAQVAALNVQLWNGSERAFPDSRIVLTDITEWAKNTPVVVTVVEA